VRRLRAVLFIALAGVLTWQVVSRSLAAYLATAAPEAALRLRPDEPVALLNLASKKLTLEARSTGAASEKPEPMPSPPRQAAEDGSTTSDPVSSTTLAGQSPAEPPAEIEASRPSGPSLAEEDDDTSSTHALAEAALVHNPLSAPALRILGQLAEAAGEEERTADLMQAAARRSIRESMAIYWLVRANFLRQDYEATARYADVLLRTRPQVLPQVLPILARMAEHAEARIALERLLAGNPPWRAKFLAALPSGISDARTPLNLLLSLKDTPTPPTAVDLRSYLSFLIGHKLYGLAYYTWLQFLPAEQLNSAGLLFNGGFESTPSGLPFDWVITPGSSVTVEIALPPDERGQRALYVEFGHGRVDFRGVSQLIVLAPGTYRLTGRYKGETAGRRGLKWRLACAGEISVVLGESAMAIGVASTWTDFEFGFVVPPACPAQRLDLLLDARSSSEKLVSGFLWYDELRISRASDTPDPMKTGAVR
jgi:hypothetical protein